MFNTVSISPYKVYLFHSTTSVQTEVEMKHSWLYSHLNGNGSDVNAERSRETESSKTVYCELGLRLSHEYWILLNFKYRSLEGILHHIESHACPPFSARCDHESNEMEEMAVNWFMGDVIRQQ